MDPLNILQIILLAVIQGLAELLPVSSSAHVIVAAKLLGLDPSAPEMTLLLVMLHTGTMFAVIAYFWQAWKRSIFASRAAFREQGIRLGFATICTAIIGVPLLVVIPKLAEKLGYITKDASGHVPKVEIESLFGNLGLVAGALFAAGILILIAGLTERARARGRALGIREAAWIGAVQGLCLPLRGFSRSGATISTGLLLGVTKMKVEEFSFALAVIITPAAILREAWRLVRDYHEAGGTDLSWAMFGPSLLGMVCAFIAGLFALRWLSRWLEGGRWYLFGIYCVVASAVVFALHSNGY